MIGLYIARAIAKGRPARRTCELIHEQGGLVYMPNPSRVAGRGGRLWRARDLIDVVEVFMRDCIAELNRKAADWAARHGFRAEPGSDAHTIAEIGRAYVEVPTSTTRRRFLEALGSARYMAKRPTRLAHVASTYAKLHKAIFRGPAESGISWPFPSIAAAARAIVAGLRAVDRIM